MYHEHCVDFTITIVIIINNNQNKLYLLNIL